MGDDVRELARTPQLWLAAAGLVLLIATPFTDESVGFLGGVAVVAAAYWWMRDRNLDIPVQFPRSTTPITAEERAQRLDTALSHEIAKGWRIESRTTHNASLVQGQRVNHVLHFLITVLTCGLWVLVWIAVALSGGERRRQLAVDLYGNVI